MNFGEGDPKADWRPPIVKKVQLRLINTRGPDNWEGKHGSGGYRSPAVALSRSV